MYLFDSPILAAYLVAFGTAALLCFVSVTRARRISDPDTRRGLVALLVTSGGWASAHVGFLVVPTPTLKHVFYTIGLIIGISAVGPWLYFCSAYTGRSLHRARPFRRFAVGIFLTIVVVKLTNPIHHLYYTAEFVTTPYPHLAVQLGLLHWIAMGIAYALATVGYFMLLELFWQIGHDTTPLVALVVVTGLPIILDVLGLVTPLLDITYEPLGVAPFAAGVVFLYLEDLQNIQLTRERDDPVILLNDTSHVREFNTKAASLFPDLETDVPVAQVAPELASHLDAEETVIEIERAGRQCYYQLSANPFTLDGSRVGQVVTLTDITDREQYRSELERQNERLDQFASMVSHDLRNPLGIARSNLTMVRKECESPLLADVEAAHDRMSELIEDLLALARQGQPIDDPEPVTLSTRFEQAWQVVETPAADYRIERDLTFMADGDRVQELFENLLRNSVEHAGPEITISVGAVEDGTGFYVADDGPGIPPDERELVFESGYTTAADGTGFGLAIVSEIVEAHGWRITVTDAADGGARFEITGVEPV